MQLAATLALMAGLAASGAPVALGDVASGQAFFAQFDANCVATEASPSAIAAKAEREHWSVADSKAWDAALAFGVDGTVKVWTYSTAGRSYTLALVDGINTQPVHDLIGLPMRECAIFTDRDQATGADGAMKEKLLAMTCEKAAGNVTRSIQWRGPGALIQWDFVGVRVPPDYAPGAGLTLMRIGADKTLADMNLRKACEPKKS